MIDLKSIKKAYLIGIKGVGMTALAQILKGRGLEVVGSDTKEVFFTDQVLAREGIKISQGFAPQNIPADTDLVIFSQAYDETNPELKFAQNRFPTISYSKALSLLLESNHGILVAGTHGKSTTTALLGWVLKQVGLDPTVLVGTLVPQFGGNALVSQKKEPHLFIVEADEYQAKFLKLKAQGAILTSVEYDHPDFFPTPQAYQEVFQQLVKKLPADGFLVYWGEEKDIEAIISQAGCQTLSYGFGQQELQATNYRIEQGLTKFDVVFQANNLGQFATKLFGQHNVLNCLGVLGVCQQLKVDWTKVKEAIASFTGTTRRLEIKGERQGVLVIDDYGHHPTEVRVTLGALKQRYPDKRIICVFHPHTFSRTKALLDHFSSAFQSADQVLVLPIYGSAREKQGDISSQQVVTEINKVSSNAQYIENQKSAVDYLKTQTKPGDLVVTMGAGDVWKVGEQFLKT